MKNWCQRALQKGAGEQTNTSQDHLHLKHFNSLTLYNHPKRGSAHWPRSHGSQWLRGLGLSPLLSHLRALLHTVRSGSSPPRQGPEHHTLLSVASSSIHPGQTESEVQTKGWPCGCSKHQCSGSECFVTKDPVPCHSIHRKLEGGGWGTIHNA